MENTSGPAFEESMGALDATVERLTQKRATHEGWRRMGLVGCSVAVLAAAGLGMASSSVAKIPPHEERVAYLLQEHPDTRFDMAYSPYFVVTKAWITQREHVWVSLYDKEWTSRHSEALSVIDGADAENSADGTPDWVWGKRPLDETTSLFCMVPYQNLPEQMRADFAKHYETSTKAYYQRFEDGLESYKSNVGKKDFEEFMRAAEELDRCGVVGAGR